MFDQRPAEMCQSRIIGMSRTKVFDQPKQSLQRLPLTHQHLAPQQVQSLNTGGAFVEAGDAHVPHNLLQSPFTDVTMPPETLQCVIRTFKCRFRHKCFGNRGENTQQLICLSACGGLRSMMADIDLQCREVCKHSRTFDQRFRSEEHTSELQSREN